jgi:hypothetical protein
MRMQQEKIQPPTHAHIFVADTDPNWLNEEVIASLNRPLLFGLYRFS